MKIHVLPAGPIQTNAYLLTENALGAAVLIDAPEGVWADVEPILKSEGCMLKELWITHGHWDHTQGAAEVKQLSGAFVRAHQEDRILIETPEVMEVFLMRGIKVPPVKVDAWVEQSEKFESLGQTVEVRHVPGHCPGNVLFYFAREKAAFVGDALFRGSIGRTDLPGGSFETLERSIHTQIYTLPADTVVYPGHGPKTTVETEMKTNPYVSA